MTTTTEAIPVLAVIPARYASTRLPGKPLALIAGRPMIQHVYGRVRQAKSVSRVLVATDDARIADAVRGFGGEAEMTSSSHRSGTERIAEVAERIPASLYINVQGDEPLIAPQAIDALVRGMMTAEAAPVGTLAVAIRERDVLDPNVVKVVFDEASRALYFSRAPIPWVREETSRSATPLWKHLGIYGYRREALLAFPKLAPSWLEQAEVLEQLRFLAHGYSIVVVPTEHDSVSVDVPADIAQVEALLAK